jgi:hypothetical protein
VFYNTKISDNIAESGKVPRMLAAFPRCYFCFVFFRKNFIRGNAATTIHQMREKKNHRGKVEEVETFQSEVANLKHFHFSQLA